MRFLSQYDIGGVEPIIIIAKSYAKRSDAVLCNCFVVALPLLKNENETKMKQLPASQLRKENLKLDLVFLRIGSEVLLIVS